MILNVYCQFACLLGVTMAAPSGLGGVGIAAIDSVVSTVLTNLFVLRKIAIVIQVAIAFK